jgi:filamentous hemagglutinin family protein
MELQMTPILNLRHTLLMSCATMAIAVAPQKAEAQSAVGAFQGTITSSPDATQTITTPGVAETITVNSPTATINWNATSNDFLPEGNTATFTSADGIADYTVLNRIVPVEGGQIQLNGSVISTLQGNASATGGNIWFYSPSGFVVGAHATFDVGGLLLTSLDPSFSTNANGFSASFAAPSSSAGGIQIDAGAQINALQKNSYVALVAPSIVQGGTVKVDGSAAYVAANQVTMTMNQGLFDIQVQLGTDDGNGIVHTGNTIGGDAESQSINHKIYMVAVPKNEALTMLLGGTIGYGASAAGYENGQVVLGAGTLGIDEIADPGTSVTILNTDSNVTIDNAHFTSDVSINAMKDVFINASEGDVTFDGNLYIRSFYSGDVSLFANGQALTANGNTSIYTGPVDFPPVYIEGNSEDRVAGNISVQATNDGTITFGDGETPGTGNVTLDASAKGQDNTGTGDGSGGDGTGGNIDINAALGGSITVNGDLWAKADGTGGYMLDGGSAGGAGYGGRVSMWYAGGTINVTGNTTMTASGTGGSYAGEALYPSVAQGGNGEGGIVEIYSDGPGSIALDGIVQLAANGSGGNGQSGGDGIAGDAGLRRTDGTVASGPSVSMSATGLGV